MKIPPKKIETKTVIDNGFWKVSQTTWQNPNGKVGNVLTMEKSKGKDAVFVLPITEQNNVLTINEFKFGREEFQTCIPAGGTDGNNPIEAAKRELLEETGYISDNFIYIGTRNQSNYIAGKMHLFIALNCKKYQEQNLDILESIEIQEHSFEKFEEMIDNNIIQCPWTINCFYYFKNKILPTL